MMSPSKPTWRGRIAALSLLVVGTAMSTTVALAPPASADTNPAQGTPATVSADALPTWQVNGIVWSQVLVGNTVFVTGNFTKARPPGVAAGGAGEVDAGSLFAYDITTGNRVATFNHSLNGAGRFITKSPDGSRIYVGGDFSTVDGQARGHVAAFTVSDGKLATFSPNISSKVSAIAVSATTIYVGGNFTKVGSATRNRLAAFRVTDGALLPWAPSADSIVTSMVLSPDNQRVVVGGQFQSLAGADASGMGSVDAATGESRPWAANQVIRNGGAQSSISSLRADGTNVYGTGYAFGTGNFEGTFSADPSTGALNWVNDCHGDTYDAAPVGDVVYNVSHVHDCTFIRDFPESNPRNVNMQHASALTNYPTTTNIGPDSYGWNFDGLPAAGMLHWYPNLSIGTVSGQGQAAWSVVANSTYVALAGEFPKVNGTAQQGLTRFALKSASTNKRGPALAADAPAPGAIAIGSGALRVSWPSAYDPDNEVLTYQVYRTGTSAPVYTTTMPSSFWEHPMMGFRDTGLGAGSYKYTVKASDPSGNSVTMAQTPPVTVGAGGIGTYAAGVLADQPTAFWRLGEDSGAAVYDYANFNDAVASSGVVRGAAGAIAGDSNAASSFDGTEQGAVSSAASVPMTPSFSVEAWFRTTTSSGGKIVGYGGSQTGNSGSYDRHVYMTDDGRIVFGLYPGGVRTLTTAKAYNDGVFHQVVATLDADAGMSLWIDGKKVANDAGTRSAQDYAGFWRIGGDNLGGWPGQPTSNYFAGTIDDVSVYPTALSRARVQQHYVDSGRVLAGPAAPVDSFGKAVVADEPTLFWRLGDAAGASVAADSSGNDVTGVPTGGGITYGEASGVGGTADTSAAFDGASGTLGSSVGFDNPRVYSEELWFKTTTTEGGKLIGFGNAQTGTSSGYDRHVYMEDSGQLTFGTYTGQTNVATSPKPYNDGAWHHLVATQGADGMKLYVDAVEVASNPQDSAQAYFGFWRVGGDSPWNGRTYFRGSLDDVAIYDHELGASDVSRHYTAGGGRLANSAPASSFAATSSDLVAAFDGSASSDPDGSIVSYGWDFGDQSAAGSGATPSHTYAAGGTYTVTLTVTDDAGASATTSRLVTVKAANRLPQASFTSAASDLVAAFDGSASSDPDGSIVSYGWDFGDQSAAGSGATPSHTYAAGGTYTVTLTVTDDAGASATTSRLVTVKAANRLPQASFTSAASDLVAAFDGSASSDPDGSIVSYGWDFGDQSAAGSGATPSHTYAAGGTYTVTLTVTDDAGASATTSRLVTVKAANRLPQASFTSAASDLVAAFDGSASSDPDGSIVSYGWDFGDQSAAGSGATPSHTYAAGGTYTVTLTVTDDAGASAKVSRALQVTAAATPLVRDTFSRVVVDGWASAEAGGSWVRSGSANRFAVRDGAGLISMTTAGSGPSMSLDALTRSSVDMVATVSLNKLPVGGQAYLQVRPRQVAAGDYYHADVRVGPTGAMTLALMRKVGTADTQLAAFSVPTAYAPGDRLVVRAQATGIGSTLLRAKVWVAGTVEPSGWSLSATDSNSALQSAGSIGLGTYLGGSVTNAPVVASFDDLNSTQAN